MVPKGTLFVVDLDGSGRTPIVGQSTGVEEKIDWSPDSSRILFAATATRLLTIGHDGGEHAAHAWKVLLRVLLARRPRLLLLGSGSRTNGYLLTMNIDGTGLKRIPEHKGAHWATGVGSGRNRR